MTQMNYTSDVLDIPRASGGDIEGQAEEWLVYLYSGAASEEGRQQFSDWLRRSPEHTCAYTRVEQLWRDLGFVIIDPAPAASAEPSTAAGADRTIAEIKPFPTPAHAQPAAARRMPGWLGIVFAAAAMLVVAVGIGWLQYEEQEPVTSIRYASGVGEHTTIQLADNSSVTLAASSVIMTHFSKRMRHVELVRGRAYFDVAPDSERVFTVEAASTEIRVVGTEFDVNKSGGGVRVSVADGLVDVADISAAAGPDELQARPVVQLAAGQQVQALLDGSIGEPEVFDPDRELMWKHGRLQYIDTRLEEILVEVNRYRDDKIILTDSSLGDLRITTTFKTTQTDQLLTGLSVSYPVEISRTPVGVLVKPKP